MAKQKRIPKRKLTKQQRREKYTTQARERRQKNSDKKFNIDKVCFNCRKKGHTVAYCPQVTPDSKYGQNSKAKICYKCGSSDHPLKKCPKLTAEEKKMSSRDKMDYHRMVLPFATCFICKQIGHLSSQCKENENGVYVKGGCCKTCGSKMHLSYMCPELNKEKSDSGDNDKNEDDQSAGDVEEFLEEDEAKIEVTRMEEEKSKPKKKKVVNF